MKKAFHIFIYLCLGIGSLHLLWAVANKATNKMAQIPDEKMNLALRRTAHLLLTSVGDSTSHILPIEKMGEATWKFRISQNFNYDSLPSILQGSLNNYHINEKYEVAILTCEEGKIVLGYQWLDFSQNQNIPCQGRELPANCYDIQITLQENKSQSQPFSWLTWIIGGGLGIVLYGLTYKKRENKMISVSLEKEEINENIVTEPTGITFGASHFDIQNQLLICKEIQHKLTYREAKLLHLFALHQNQILARELLLEKVWADEGIIVGRSLDMFVSRLRKMLKDDPSIQLVAVHGVGYKLEIKNE